VQARVDGFCGWLALTLFLCEPEQVPNVLGIGAGIAGQGYSAGPLLAVMRAHVVQEFTLRPKPQ
jgi:hypothetical protein